MDILDEPIESLDLNLSAYRCLRQHGIYTVAELIHLNKYMLKKVRNLGPPALQEIEAKLAEVGLELSKIASIKK